jgi:hypothetical protein
MCVKLATRIEEQEKSAAQGNASKLRVQTVPILTSSKCPLPSTSNVSNTTVAPAEASEYTHVEGLRARNKERRRKNRALPIGTH